MERFISKRLVRKRDLEFLLSNIAENPFPKAFLEQYTTSSKAAADTLYLAAYIHDDIIEKTVMELGCGTARLAIGAVLLGAKEVFGVDLDKNAVDNLVNMKLGLVHLSGYENHLPSEISGGMKKRAGLARAMALNPKILFFDEPSAGLDPVTSAELDNLIISLNKNLGTTMVIVTHELQSIFAVAHRVIMLHKNHRGIIATGDPNYLREHSQNPFVKQFFNRRATGDTGTD